MDGELTDEQMAWMEAHMDEHDPEDVDDMAAEIRASETAADDDKGAE